MVDEDLYNLVQKIYSYLTSDSLPTLIPKCNKKTFSLLLKHIDNSNRPLLFHQFNNDQIDIYLEYLQKDGLKITDFFLNLNPNQVKDLSISSVLTFLQHAAVYAAIYLYAYTNSSGLISSEHEKKIKIIEDQIGHIPTSSMRHVISEQKIALTPPLFIVLSEKQINEINFRSTAFLGCDVLIQSSDIFFYQIKIQSLEEWLFSLKKVNKVSVFSLSLPPPDPSNFMISKLKKMNHSQIFRLIELVGISSSRLQNLFKDILNTNDLESFIKEQKKKDSELLNYTPTPWELEYMGRDPVANKPPIGCDLQYAEKTKNIRERLQLEKQTSYQVFGFDVKPSQEELAARYRALVTVVHPDKNRGKVTEDDAAKIFKCICAVYKAAIEIYYS